MHHQQQDARAVLLCDALSQPCPRVLSLSSINSRAFKSLSPPTSLLTPAPPTDQRGLPPPLLPSWRRASLGQSAVCPSCPSPCRRRPSASRARPPSSRCSPSRYKSVSQDHKHVAYSSSSPSSYSSSCCSSPSVSVRGHQSHCHSPRPPVWAAVTYPSTHVSWTPRVRNGCARLVRRRRPRWGRNCGHA